MFAHSGDQKVKRIQSILFGGAISVLFTSISVAEGPTYTKDAAPILNENCVVCHRPFGTNLTGMVAPMAFSTYREVRPWAKAIKTAVVNKDMPPWHASEDSHGVFKNERTLTQAEIDTISAWVDSGAPRGNPEDEPAPPAILQQQGWSIGEPDLILGFPKPFFVPDSAEDIQPIIVVDVTEEMLPEPRWIQAIEFKPGSEVVHHVVAMALDPNDPDRFDNRTLIGRVAPGTDAQRYDEGYGFLLKPNTKIAFGMHYHKEVGPGTGAYDSTQMGIKFQEGEVIHPVDISAISHGDFEVPPYNANWRVGGAHIFDEDFIIVDLMPHTHLRGTAARYTAFYPDGTNEILLDVPRYDYNWQTGYEYKEYKRMPAGTRLQWEINYDNSEAHAAKGGFDPSQAVRFGGPTTDEMDLGFITYALQEPGKQPKSFGAGK